MPRPKAASSARATGCAGARSATVSCPPVTAAGTIADFGNTSVSGPGQKASASRAAGSGTSAAQARAAREIAEVHDERMARRPSLGGEDARNRRGIRSVGAESVDGFGRERDQLSRVQPGDGLLDLPGLRHLGASSRAGGMQRFQPVSVRRNS